MVEKNKGHCQHGEFILAEGCLERADFSSQYEVNMSAEAYVCPKCNGTQNGKGKCKQCGTKVVTLDEWLRRREK